MCASSTSRLRSGGAVEFRRATRFVGGGAGWRTLCVLLAVLPSLVAAGGCRAASPSVTAGVTIMGLPAYGLRVGTVTPGVFTFATREEWVKFWSSHRDGQIPAPEVDFSSWTIVGIFRGSRPNRGYGVEVTGGRTAGGELVLSVTDWLPDPTAGYSALVVYPFDIVAVPAGYRVKLTEERHQRGPNVPEKELPLTLVPAVQVRASTASQYVLFTDAQMWQRFWQAQGQAQPPAVDFGSNAVAGVLNDPAVRGAARAVRKGGAVRLEIEVTATPSTPRPASTVLCLVPAAQRISFSLQFTSDNH